MSALIDKVPDSWEKRRVIARRLVGQMSSTSSASACITVLRHATLVDALGTMNNGWLVMRNGSIYRTGAGDYALEAVANELESVQKEQDYKNTISVIDVQGHIVCPGFIDIHSHGGWGSAFDDGEDAIAMARSFHLLHGTTRQVLSLITNPWNDLLHTIRVASRVVLSREDVLGLHLEGPFLSPQHKGAHDEECLLDPTQERVEAILEASQTTLRQITIAPELEHGISAIEGFARAGVRSAVGHCDADYNQTREAFDHGARILTHMFNAMNGISHRAPGPIAAAAEDESVIAEIIADGFHVHTPALRIAAQLVPHRLALVTDSMSAAGCPDGSYTLGNLDVDVKDGHARLVSNGAIAGSTLNLEEAVQRMVFEVGLSVQDAIEAATFTPARAVGVDQPQEITQAPLGLLREGYAADALILDKDSLSVRDVWCSGVRVDI